MHRGPADVVRITWPPACLAVATAVCQRVRARHSTSARRRAGICLEDQTNKAAGFPIDPVAVRFGFAAGARTGYE